MKIISDLLGTPAGMASLLVILFMLAMAVFLAAMFIRKSGRRDE